ncbi:MAG: alpha-glucosidase [Propionibacteriaceae bacterium]
MTRLDARSRLREVYAHPVGRDAIDKILLQLGRSRRWVDNPVVSRLRLGTLARLARPVLGAGFADSFLAVLAAHPDRADGADSAQTSSGEAGPAWWRTAVFYQVYPRSFADSDGDGVGDLRGLTARLDHLADLGVDCVWLSPIFDSPNEDMGYDVRDYRAVMAEMGTLGDLDELIAGCHRRGMRIILDLVVNHTSDEHPWFRAAVADPDGPYGDYYHLRPGRVGEDGTGPPPNNWTSFFGGSAWRWVPEAERWALHLFAEGQVDLNWENPAVVTEVADIVRWWRGRGIDGFRMDVINYISKQPGLPDGSAAVGRLMGFVGIEHYFFGPRLHDHLRELRERGFTVHGDDQLPASTVRTRDAKGVLGESLPPDPVGIMVGETPGVGVEMGRLLSGADRGELDLVFNFDVLETPGRIRWDDYRYDLRHLKTFYTDLLARTGDRDRIALFLDNHDNPRMISKVLGPQAADPDLRTAVAKVLATIQLTLPGTPFLFQGQEIGAINQDFGSVSELRDVESRNRYAELRDSGLTADRALAQVLSGARDHARVPMRWEPGPNTGFSSGEAWQPGREESVGYTVAEQAAEPDSVLAFHRELITLRRSHPVLADGGIRFLAPRSRDYFGWARTDADGRDAWLVEVNLTDRPVRRPVRTPAAEVVLASSGERGPIMGPYQAVVARVPDQTARRRDGVQNGVHE